MKITDLFWLMLAAILMALGASPASAAGTRTAAVLKAQLVKEITPLPKEIWGKLEVTDFKAIVRDKVAVTNWVAKEDEGYFGQVIHAHYRTTDTSGSTPQG